MRGKPGFSLVELLIVIAVIGLLMAMLTPTLSRAREYARVTVCRASLGNLAKANITYAAANNQFYAHPRQWVTNVYAHWTLATQAEAEAHMQDGTLWRYTRSLEVYCCPTFRIAAGLAPKLSYTCGRLVTYPVKPHPENFLIRSYTINSNVGETGGSQWINLVVGGQDRQVRRRIPTATDAARPGDLAMFSEESPWRIPTYAPHPMNDSVLYVPDGSYIDAISDHHLTPPGLIDDGWGLVAYCDGHVRRRRPWHTQRDFRNEYIFLSEADQK